MKRVVQIITACNVDLEVNIEKTIYAPPDTAYIVPKNMDSQTFFRSMYEAEKEKNEWIRKYDNLLKGIKFLKIKHGYRK